MDRTCSHASEQGDGAFVAYYRSRLDDTGVIDNACQQFIACACAHQHDATIGANQALVLCKAV